MLYLGIAVLRDRQVPGGHDEGSEPLGCDRARVDVVRVRCLALGMTAIVDLVVIAQAGHGVV
jgi:hypothetical protein